MGVRIFSSQLDLLQLSVTTGSSTQKESTHVLPFIQTQIHETQVSYSINNPCKGKLVLCLLVIGGSASPRPLRMPGGRGGASGRLADQL